MNIKELEQALSNMHVPVEFYSLNGDILPDRIVLLKNYFKWEVFYFDERGNRDQEKIFSSEEEACDYIFQYFEKQKGIDNKNSRI